MLIYVMLVMLILVLIVKSYTSKLPCKTGPAQNERKVRWKIAEHIQKIGGIHKHVGRKTADGVPCLSFSAQILH